MKVCSPRKCRHSAYFLLGRVEDGRGSLGRAATPRFPSPLIEPDVRRYRIRLSDRLHRKAHGEAGRGKRSRASTPRSPWITSKVNCRLPRPCTLPSPGTGLPPMTRITLPTCHAHYPGGL